MSEQLQDDDAAFLRDQAAYWAGFRPENYTPYVAKLNAIADRLTTLTARVKELEGAIGCALIDVEVMQAFPAISHTANISNCERKLRAALTPSVKLQEQSPFKDA